MSKGLEWLLDQMNPQVKVANTTEVCLLSRKERRARAKQKNELGSIVGFVPINAYEGAKDSGWK